MRTYLTNQDIFNGVWDHFVVKKNPKSTHSTRTSFFGTSKCIYAGTGCAIGCLLTDKQLCEDMDSRSNSSIRRLLDHDVIGSRIRQYLLIKFEEIVPIAQITVEFLEALQRTHDSASKEDFTKDIKINLCVFAEFNKLKVPDV